MSTKPVLAVAASFALAAAAPGALIVQELWDAVAGPPPGTDVTLNGAGDTATSIGFASGSTWATNGTYGDQIFTASNFNVQPLPGLPPQASATGGVYWNAATSHWDKDIYATRQLATTINFADSQTLYFGVRLRNGSDTAVGLGFADGPNGSANFVGAGLTWNNATAVYGSDAANSLYLSMGTLDQNLGGSNVGPYAILAHTAAGSIDGSGLIVGRLTLNPTGNDLIDLKLYRAGDAIEEDPADVTWSLQGAFESDLQASHMLLWLNGGGWGGELDAIRVGTSWNEVPEPSAALLAFLGLLALPRRRR